MLNVLFITADQWRGDCLSALDHPCVRTPNLDRLAASGTLFTRHYSQASPCSPGRASLYTGLYLHNHRVVMNGTPLDARHTNVALEARKLGYEPLLFGYTDMAVDPRSRAPGDPDLLRTYGGILPGMTPVVPMDDDHWPWRRHLARRGYDVPEDTDALFAPGHDDRAPGQVINGAASAWAPEDSAAGFLTDKVIEHLSASESEAWFVHLSYLAPHPPFIASAPYNAMYDPAQVPPPVRAPTPEEEARQHPYLAWYLHHQRDSGIAYDHDPHDNLALGDRDIRQARANYYAMMSEIDAQIGRLLEALSASGADERTLIVFTSDHGEHLGDHWQFSKFCYFDQAFHVPLIVRDPRPGAASGRGGRISAFTENVDLMPTILDALGAQVPPPVRRRVAGPPSSQGTHPNAGAGKRISSSTSATCWMSRARNRSDSRPTSAPSTLCAASDSNTCTSPHCPHCFSTSKRTRRSSSTAPGIPDIGIACSNTPRRC